jgi:hypothetical protein
MTTNIFRKHSLDCFVAALLAMTMLLCCPALAQTPNLKVCANQGFSLVSAEDADGIKPITYEWYENGTPIINSNTTSLSFSAGKATPGIYQYVRKASNAACTELPSNTYTVEVLPPPAAPTLTRSAATFCAGNAITFTATGGSGTYAWNCSSFTCSGSGDTQTTPTTTGTYAARVRSVIESGSVSCYSAYTPAQNAYITSATTVSWSACAGITAISLCGAFESSTTFTNAGASTHCPALYGSGWRLPTQSEASCICSHKVELNGLIGEKNYWTSDAPTKPYCNAFGTYQMIECRGGECYNNTGHYVYLKCVR